MNILEDNYLTEGLRARVQPTELERTAFRRTLIGIFSTSEMKAVISHLYDTAYRVFGEIGEMGDLLTEEGKLLALQAQAKGRGILYALEEIQTLLNEQEPEPEDNPEPEEE